MGWKVERFFLGISGCSFLGFALEAFGGLGFWGFGVFRGCGALVSRLGFEGHEVFGFEFRACFFVQPGFWAVSFVLMATHVFTCSTPQLCLHGCVEAVVSC